MIRQIVIRIILLLLLGQCVFYSRFEHKVFKSGSQWLSDFPLSSIGPLKGILIASWWMKIQALQRKFEYQEILPLTEKICYLQPNLPEIWEFLAWNMSFNLVAEEKHNLKRQEFWLISGLECLRKGLKYNPGDSKLNFFIAWTVFLKLRGDRNFYEELKLYLGEEPIQYAHKKIVQSDVISKNNYTHASFYLLVCHEANQREDVLRAAEKLKMNFPEELPATLEMLKNLGIKL